MTNLLYKMERYDIQEIHLTGYHHCMKVVVDDEGSKRVKVESGVPQGTVFGSLMFLCHINDIPDLVQSQVRLFADHCLLYRSIKPSKDHGLLHNYLHELENGPLST